MATPRDADVHTQQGKVTAPFMPICLCCTLILDSEAFFFFRMHIIAFCQLSLYFPPQHPSGFLCLLLISSILCYIYFFLYFYMFPLHPSFFYVPPPPSPALSASLLPCCHLSLFCHRSQSILHPPYSHCGQKSLSNFPKGEAT